MAFRRSPVRSRSGPPSFAHACNGRSELRLGKPREGCRAEAAKPRRWAAIDPSSPCRRRRPKNQRAGSESLAETATPASGRGVFRVSERSSPGHLDCQRRDMAADKRFVYVLRNADRITQFYVGLTSDVNARLADHNAGHCPDTASRRPWQLHVVIEFSDEQRAIRFEHYLKSGSGRAFAKRHFEP